jgi:pimeloyl-ACP methyl ester carboxylesterase
MNGPNTRSLTFSRALALALIALVAGGLAFLRFGTGDDTVSVPSGAKAGDLFLESCDYATEDGSYAADCGTLVVRENPADPQSKLIALPVTRIHAVSGAGSSIRKSGSSSARASLEASASRPHRTSTDREPIFRLEGGPGLTNMTFPLASRYAVERDVVLVGYRGVDGSVRLDCPEVDSALRHATDLLGEQTFRAYGNGFRACAGRLADEGYDLGQYGLSQQVDDMEAARKALGYDRIDLLSESAGTRTALIYAWRHPQSIHRSVMIGVNPPGHFLWSDETTDEQIARYAELCAQDDGCRDRTDDLAATMRRTADDMPDRWFFLPIDGGAVQVFSFYGLMETTPETPLNAPAAIDSWLAADDGDASGFWFESLLADIAPMPFVWGQYAAAARLDADAAAEYFSAPDRTPGPDLARAATAFSWGGGRLADGWPAAPDEDAYDRVRTSKVETLLIGGELDFSTPPQVARRELLPYLPNGHQVVLPGFGHSLTFWNDQADAGTHLVTTFLSSGRVDGSRYVPQQVDFTPDASFPALAKGIAGSMVGLALLTVLSLLWLARRVHKRGRVGRRASATVRSLYAVVLGLGGWFLGVLIAITTMPSVPLTDALLNVLSIGVPVGLGIYLAWLDRAWSSRTRSAGFVAAVAGAFAGTWLGIHAADGLLSLVAGIAGAIAGANLLLILLDMSRAGSRDPQATLAVDEQRPPVALPGGVGTR